MSPFLTTQYLLIDKKFGSAFHDATGNQAPEANTNLPWLEKLPDSFSLAGSDTPITVRCFHLPDGNYYWLRPQRSKVMHAEQRLEADRHGSLGQGGFVTCHLGIGPAFAQSGKGKHYYCIREFSYQSLPPSRENYDKTEKKPLHDKNELQRFVRAMVGQEATYTEVSNNPFAAKYCLERKDGKKAYLLVPLAKGTLRECSSMVDLFLCHQPDVFFQRLVKDIHEKSLVVATETADSVKTYLRDEQEITLKTKEAYRNHFRFLKGLSVKHYQLFPHDEWDWQRRSAAAYQLMLNVAKQLKPLHDLGILHQDIRVDNILRCFDSGEPCLADFNAAQNLQVRRPWEEGSGRERGGAPVFHRPPELINPFDPTCSIPLHVERLSLEEWLRADVYMLAKMVSEQFVEDSLNRKQPYTPSAFRLLDGGLAEEDRILMQHSSLLGRKMILGECPLTSSQQTREEELIAALQKQAIADSAYLKEEYNPETMTAWYQHQQYWQQVKQLEKPLPELLVKMQAYDAKDRPSIDEVIALLEQNPIKPPPGELYWWNYTCEENRIKQLLAGFEAWLAQQGIDATQTISQCFDLQEPTGLKLNPPPKIVHRPIAKSHYQHPKDKTTWDDFLPEGISTRLEKWWSNLRWSTSCFCDLIPATGYTTQKNSASVDNACTEVAVEVARPGSSEIGNEDVFASGRIPEGEV